MAAHTLKGSARAVGAWRLARDRRARREAGAARRRLPRASSVVRRLEEAPSEARAYIAALGSDDLSLDGSLRRLTLRPRRA